MNTFGGVPPRMCRVHSTNAARLCEAVGTTSVQSSDATFRTTSRNVTAFVASFRTASLRLKARGFMQRVFDSEVSTNMSAYRFLCNIVGLYAACLVVGCGAGQPIRVLERGATQLTASVGGPVVPSSSPTKLIPYFTVGGMYGLTDEVTVHGNLHGLMLVFGTLGVDAGASTRIVKQNGAWPEITVGLRAIFFTDFSSLANTRVYPDASFIASWEVQPQWLVYGGTHVTAQFSDAKIFISPMVGVQAPITDRFSMQLEVMWQAANAATSSGLFRGESSLNGHGSLALFIGASYSL